MNEIFYQTIFPMCYSDPFITIDFMSLNDQNHVILGGQEQLWPWKTSRREVQACHFTGSDDCAAALSSKHLRAQQIKIFIGGYKPEHPIGDEEDKFTRNANGGIISFPDGRIFLMLYFYVNVHFGQIVYLFDHEYVKFLYTSL